MNDRKSFLSEYAVVITIAIVAALMFRAFVFEAYRIPSRVMYPTLLTGDLIFVAKWPFGLRYSLHSKSLTKSRIPKLAEIVTYFIEDDQVEYIKRVVGLEGDTIEIKDGHVIRNGVQLPFVEQNKSKVCGYEKLQNTSYSVCIQNPAIDGFGPKTIPEGNIFVIGDFRRAGESQRSWDVIPIDTLRGNPRWIWLSIEPRLESESSQLIPRIRFERVFRSVQSSSIH